MRGIEQFLQVDAATLGALKYAGTWNASTNTPTLASGVGVQGQYYVVSVAGSTNLDGETAWQVGDWAVFNGSVWQKVDGGSTGLLTTLTVTGNTYLATTSGSVGVGTASPTGFGKFEVYQSANNRILFSGASAYGNNAIAGINDAGSEISMGIAGSPVAFYTNATERMRITSTGDVGIGTTGPSVKLQVNGTSNGTTLELLRLSNIGTGANTKSRLNFYAAGTNYGSITGGYGASAPEMVFDINTTAGAYIWNNNATEQMRINASGNVGIGTSSPNTRLEVSGTEAAVALKVDTNNAGVSSGNYSEIQLSDVGTVRSYWRNVRDGSGKTAFLYNDHLSFLSFSGTERVRITAGGDVGIGTTSPDAKLRVNGTAKIGEGAASNTSKLMVNTVSGVAAGIQLFQDANESWIIQNPASTTALTFANSGTERMRLDSAGNFGLGVVPSAWNSTSKAIQISTFVSVSQQADGAANFGFNFYESGANSFTYSTTDEACRFSALTTGGFGWFTAPSGTAGNAISFTQAMTLDASGNLLVGQTSNISGKLQVSGAGGIRINEDGAGTKVVFLRSDYAGLGPAIQVSTTDPLLFLTSNTERARIPSAGGMVVGTAALATNATDGFLYVPTCAGTPTGTPTTQTGTAPIVIDTTNNKLYFYSGGQWRDAGP